MFIGSAWDLSEQVPASTSEFPGKVRAANTLAKIECLPEVDFVGWGQRLPLNMSPI